MSKWLSSILVLLALSSCHKQRPTINLEGDYHGSFQRTSPTALFPPAQVNLHLKNHSFSGMSSDARYPAICLGSWTVEEGQIEFANGCIWTADFDWTFILDGSWQYELKGNHLRFWKQRDNDVTDTYDLDRQ